MSVVYVFTDDLCGTCKVYSVRLLPPNSAVEANDLCSGCAQACSLHPVRNVPIGGWEEKAVRVRSPYWQSLYTPHPLPNKTPPPVLSPSVQSYVNKVSAMTPVSGSLIGDMTVGTWTMLDPNSYDAARVERKPIVDLNSECPCGGGLLRKQCKWHGGGPECH